MNKEPTTIKLLPRGLIFYSLGGYLGGVDSRKNADSVDSALKDFLKRNNCAIFYDPENDILDFADIQIKHTEES